MVNAPVEIWEAARGFCRFWPVSGRLPAEQARRLPLPVSTAERVLGTLRIRPGERGRVAVMMVYSVAAMGGVHTVGKSVASALFLSRLPASAIPYLFVLPGVVTAATLVVYSRLARTRSLNRIVVGSMGVLLACVLAFWGVLVTSHSGRFAFLAALFVVVDLATTLALLQFWTYAGEVFNVLEARRLFGLIAIGGTVSNIVAGLTLRHLSALIGVDNLLLLVAASLAACAACGWALGRRHEPQRVPGEASMAEAAQAVAETPLLRAIGVLTVLVAVMVSLGTYQFFIVTRDHFGADDAAMVAFLGSFQIWAGVAALVVQLDLTGRVMGKFGAIGALLAFPAGMAATGVASLASGGGLGSITAMRATDPVLRHTINQAGLNVLYLPTPPRIARRAKE